MTEHVLDDLEAYALGARQLVVRAVPDEQAIRRLDAEPLAGDLVDSRVGLREADLTGEDQLVQRTRERCLVPDVGDVLGADADQPQQMASLTELVERLERVRAGLAGPTVLGPYETIAPDSGAARCRAIRTWPWAW